MLSCPKKRSETVMRLLPLSWNTMNPLHPRKKNECVARLMFVSCQSCWWSMVSNSSTSWCVNYLLCAYQAYSIKTISYAATYGLTTEAGLVGQQFSTLITLFYLGYLIAQYPANYIMQRFPVGRVITICFLLWGITLATMGSATNFKTLATARFFLGVFESCVNPGFILITSSWWKREEQLTRIGYWYSANGLFGMPAVMIFYGIAHIKVCSAFDQYCLR